MCPPKKIPYDLKHMMISQTVSIQNNDIFKNMVSII